jgi:hypothetical protein
MSARHKLHNASILGNLLFAGMAGLMAESWFVFLVALAGLCSLAVHSGDIRPTPRR